MPALFSKLFFAALVSSADSVQLRGHSSNETANITGWHKDLGKGLAVTHNVDTVGGQTNATETYATTHTRTAEDVSYEAHLKAEAEKAAAAAAAAAANNSSNATAALSQLRVHMRNETGNKTITGWHKDLGKGLAVTHNVDTVGGQTNATETYATTHTRTAEDVSYAAHLKAEAEALAAAAAAAAANNSSNATATLTQLIAHMLSETRNESANITGWHKDLGKGLAVTHNVDTVGGQTNATETYATTHTRTAEDVSYEAHLKAEAEKAAAAAANNSSNATAALIQLRALVRNETGNKTITGWHKELGKGLAVTHNVDTVGGQTNATETYATTHTRTAEDVSYVAHLKAEAAAVAAAAAAAAANNSSNATAALTQLLTQMQNEIGNESANITGWHKDLGKGLAVTHNVDTVGGQTNATEAYTATHTRTAEDVSYEAHLKAEAAKAAAAKANNSSNATL